MEKMPVANTQERLLSLLETLEECRAFVLDGANPEVARLLSLAVLELRMELHKVTDSELKAVCELMDSDEQIAQAPNFGFGKRLPAYLKLIK